MPFAIHEFQETLEPLLKAFAQRAKLTHEYAQYVKGVRCKQGGQSQGMEESVVAPTRCYQVCFVHRWLSEVPRQTLGELVQAEVGDDHDFGIALETTLKELSWDGNIDQLDQMFSQPRLISDDCAAPHTLAFSVEGVLGRYVQYAGTEAHTHLPDSLAEKDGKIERERHAHGTATNAKPKKMNPSNGDKLGGVFKIPNLKMIVHTSLGDVSTSCLGHWPSTGPSMLVTAVDGTISVRLLDANLVLEGGADLHGWLHKQPPSALATAPKILLTTGDTILILFDYQFAWWFVEKVEG